MTDFPRAPFLSANTSIIVCSQCGHRFLLVNLKRRKGCLIPRSQDCMGSLQVLSGCTDVPVTHALTRSRITPSERWDTSKDTGNKSIRQYAQICLPARFWVLILLLLVTTSTNSCAAGVCPDEHSQSRLKLNRNVASITHSLSYRPQPIHSNILAAIKI